MRKYLKANRTLSLPFLLLTLATGSSLLGACGSSDDNSGGNGDGDGDMTGGDGDGDVTGGDGDAQGSGGSSGNNEGTGGNDGENQGTGGGSAEPTLVPGTSLFSCDAPTGDLPSLRATAVLTNEFSRAVLVTHAPDDNSRLFVAEQDGTIRIIKNGSVTGTFLDISDVVRTAGGWEQGLLGLAFHPDYDENGLFYVHHTAEEDHLDAGAGDTVIAEYQVSGDDPDVADPTSARNVLTVDQPPENMNGTNHNGGTITFGADGMLHIALGDGGGSGDTHRNGQNTDTLLGAISRIDPVQAGDEPYSIPMGNLTDAIPTAAPELWNYGLRNPYRINFDGCNGDLYIGDVGQGGWEEVDIEKAGDGGYNYGWPITEGNDCFGAATCDRAGLRAPFAQFDTDGSSITGGSVYRGTSIPALRGAYVYGEHTGGRMFWLRYDSENDTATDAVDITAEVGLIAQGITSIQNSADGEIWITTSNSLYQLTAAP